MAKKTVATLKSKSNKYTKVIKMVKSPQTGAYIFEESIVPSDLASGILKD